MGMKYRIDYDEAYPVFSVRPAVGHERGVIDLPDELVARYQAALEEWISVQHALRDACGYDDPPTPGFIFQ